MLPQFHGSATAGGRTRRTSPFCPSSHCIPPPPGATVFAAPAVSHLAIPIPFLTLDLCAIAAVPVQLKAVVENWALYMVF